MKFSFEIEIDHDQTQKPYAGTSEIEKDINKELGEKDFASIEAAEEAASDLANKALELAEQGHVHTVTATRAQPQGDEIESALCMAAWPQTSFDKAELQKAYDLIEGLSTAKSYIDHPYCDELNTLERYMANCGDEE